MTLRTRWKKASIFVTSITKLFGKYMELFKIYEIILNFEKCAAQIVMCVLTKINGNYLFFVQ